MVAQPSLFDLPEHGLARASDPETSHEAAGSLDATRLEGLVLDSLRHHAAGYTTEELSERLGLPLVSVSPRMAPLLRKSLIAKSIEKRVNRSGRSAIVWQVNPAH